MRPNVRICRNHIFKGKIDKPVQPVELSEGELAEEGVRRVRSIVGSPDFAQEMRRFMPRTSFDEMLGSSLKLGFMADEVCGLYERLT